jgi:alpha-amylase
MNGSVRLALVLHNHQPVGNFEHVFEEAYQKAYRPFLDALFAHPQIRCVLHNSGSLLEWLVEEHPDYLEDIKDLIQKERVELLGGPFFEPILSGIPKRDRTGQIAAYTRYLEQLFETDVRGMWMPERVWEQGFASDIVDAGLEYTLLDDFHFRNAGFSVEDLHGYYLTEDEGRLLQVFPDSERLRYLIPFSNPYDVIQELRNAAERFQDPVIVFGDDGEKFGAWPNTYKHVYEDGWLDKFFGVLSENADWIKLVTLRDVIESDAATGRAYLPDCAYREMTEWTLPADKQLMQQRVVAELSQREDWPDIQQFLRGGFWRNFRAKYSEANEMYCRMLEISKRVESLRLSPQAREAPQLLADARAELYRGQCNCAYWHGAFGGLYLPHLRNAVYRHLINAENAILSAEGRSGDWVEIEFGDYDLDNEEEIKLSSDRLAVYLKPSRGGTMYELDLRTIGHNLLATLDRRPEPYHQKIKEAAAQQKQPDGSIEDLNSMVKFKHPKLERHLKYDSWPRKSLVDHLLLPGASFDQLLQGRARIANLHRKQFDFVTDRSAGEVRTEMITRINWLGRPVAFTKKLWINTQDTGTINISYAFDNLPPNETIHFGVEFNFAGMAGESEDRYFYDHAGRQFGPLKSRLDWTDVSRIGIVDEWLGVDACLDFSTPAGIWALPIQTVSQSEGGYELVFQNCSMLPHWEFPVVESGHWEVDITLSVDTSMASARTLAEADAAATS